VTVVAVAEARKRHRRGSEVVHALDGVSIDIEAGEVVALLGPSGSGKSSLLHLLCGWEEPDEGSVAWSPEARTGTWAGTAVVPQSLGLLDELSIAENVALPLRLSRSSGDVDGLLDSLGIARLRDRAVGEVSMGEQQRAAVARALVARPRLLLADEPTSHLDHVLVEEVFAHLRAAALTGTAVVVATHDPAGLERADRVVHLRDGRIESVERAYG